MKTIYQAEISRLSTKMKLYFARDTLKLIGAGGIIKKHHCDLLKLPQFPVLGKLEACDTLPLSDRFTLLSLEMKYQFSNACSMITRLVRMKDKLTSACRTMSLVEMKDQLTSTCCATMRMVVMKDQLTSACCATMRMVKIRTNSLAHAAQL